MTFRRLILRLILYPHMGIQDCLVYPHNPTSIPVSPYWDTRLEGVVYPHMGIQIHVSPYWDTRKGMPEIYEFEIFKVFRIDR